jgi:hypothetical protein
LLRLYKNYLLKIEQRQNTSPKTTVSSQKLIPTNPENPKLIHVFFFHRGLNAKFNWQKIINHQNKPNPRRVQKLQKSNHNPQRFLRNASSSFKTPKIATRNTTQQLPAPRHQPIECNTDQQLNHALERPKIQDARGNNP